MTERKDEAEPSSTIETDLKQKKKRIKQETNTNNQSKKVYKTDNIYIQGGKVAPIVTENIPSKQAQQILNVINKLITIQSVKVLPSAMYFQKPVEVKYHCVNRVAVQTTNP